MNDLEVIKHALVTLQSTMVEILQELKRANKAVSSIWNKS